MSYTKSVPNGKGGQKTVWVDDEGHEYDSADILNLPTPPKTPAVKKRKAKKARSKK